MSCGSMQRFSFLGQRSSSSCASRPTGNKLRTCTISSHCYAARPLRAEGDSHICRALRRLPSILRERSFPLNFAALGEELEGGKFKLQNRGRLECFHSASSPWCGVCTAREPSSDVCVLDCVGCFCFLFCFSCRKMPGSSLPKVKGVITSWTSPNGHRAALTFCGRI